MNKSAKTVGNRSPNPVRATRTESSRELNVEPTENTIKRLIELLEAKEQFFIRCPTCGSNEIFYMPLTGYFCLNPNCKKIGEVFNFKYDEEKEG